MNPILSQPLQTGEAWSKPYMGGTGWQNLPSRGYDEPFRAYPKTPRLNREAIISEKLDGTNAQIVISLTSEVTSRLGSRLSPEYFCTEGDFAFRAGSRSKWIMPGKNSDNYGFAAWVLENKSELVKLGVGTHFGEFWGQGIQRNYGLKEKRFSLFNAGRWIPAAFNDDGLPNGPGVFERDEEDNELAGPACCHVVPVIWKGVFDSFDVRSAVEMLRSHGSFAAPGFMKPEGVIVYHSSAKQCFKVLLENDESPKGE